MVYTNTLTHNVVCIPPRREVIILILDGITRRNNDYTLLHHAVRRVYRTKYYDYIMLKTIYSLCRLIMLSSINSPIVLWDSWVPLGGWGGMGIRDRSKIFPVIRDSLKYLLGIRDLGDSETSLAQNTHLSLMEFLKVHI